MFNVTKQYHKQRQLLATEITEASVFEIKFNKEAKPRRVMFFSQKHDHE
jgi:hypothetical protein